jgi:hypothetical protein
MEMTTYMTAQQYREAPEAPEAFELDRLFGLALTDAHFFHRLRQRPQEIVAQFSLTASEAMAVLDIAPAASSVEELAVQLDLWMTSNAPAPVRAPSEERLIRVDTFAQRPVLSRDPLVGVAERSGAHLPHQDRARAARRDDEHTLCLKVNQYAPRR